MLSKSIRYCIWRRPGIVHVYRKFFSYLSLLRSLRAHETNIYAFLITFCCQTYFESCFHKLSILCSEVHSGVKAQQGFWLLQ